MSARLSEALALWRGPALADFAGARWADDEAARLDEVRLQAIERRLDAELALGHHKAVVAEVEPLVAAYPLRERLCELQAAGYTDFSIYIRHGHLAMLEEWAEVIAGV